MTLHNLGELHSLRAERLGPRPALRFKRYGLYHDLTWTDYRAAALAGAAALIEADIAPGDRVGLLSENRVEWLVADMAILSAGAVTVSPHAPLTARQVHYQLHDAGVRWAIVSNAEQLAKLQQVRDELPNLRAVVAFERAQPQAAIASWDAFLHAGWAALRRVGAELARREATIGPDDLATIMYTSGTTGNPKGVMLTHGNLLSNAESMQSMVAPRPDDVILSWLPFTHIYARTVDHYGGLFSGVLTCLAESADTLVQNLEDVRPTRMASVPRFYEKVLAACAAADPKQTARDLRRVFGDRVDWLSSGGAPLPPAIAQVFLDAGIPVLQGYGLTESSPVISFNTKEHYKLATVGLPIPGVEVKIAPDGEVLTRGPHVMKGYWNDPAATAAAIRDGWLHTGDLGSIDADGYLAITGRKKELLVLSNGKKVVPSYLEGMLLADPCIDQALIIGEARNFLTALLVPHWGNVVKALTAEGIEVPADNASRAAHPSVVEFLRKRVAAALADISHMEQVKKFVVLPEPFSVANDELTVSLKMRRNVILARNAARIEELYQGK
jgi:long-chain acyl-CoA synthetase